MRYAATRATEPRKALLHVWRLGLSLLATAVPCRAAEVYSLLLDTSAGVVALEIDAAAAPESVAALLAAASEPGDDGAPPRPQRCPGEEPAPAFAGLAFFYARPHLELRLASPRPEERPTVASEIDAAALGLDEQRVEGRGEAMDLMQSELLPLLRRPGAEGRPTERLAEWAERFAAGYDASFLIGKSRKEILEAEGYAFRDGLASLAPVRGSVALVPRSPTESSLSLAILLADHPHRRGRWTVIGRVVAGLEVADAVSTRPLAVPAERDYRPESPVAVDRAVLRCELPSTPLPSPPGE